MLWLLLCSHEELSVSQVNVQASESPLCCHLANVFPGAGQTSWGSWMMQGWKRQGFHNLLYHICPNTFVSSLLPPLLGSVTYTLDLLTFICKTYSPCPSSPVPASLCSTASPFFLTISGLRVSLNPDTASISSLWTTHLRHMCRNLTKKKRGSVKRRNMHTWPSSPLHL